MAYRGPNSKFTGVSVGNGNATTPSFSFTGDLDTGLYSGGTNILAFGTNGTKRATIDASGILNLVGTSFKMNSDSNVGTISWTPTTTRTWTIPDATDTAVGLATTDTLSNKTVATGSFTGTSDFQGPVHITAADATIRLEDTDNANDEHVTMVADTVGSLTISADPDNTGANTNITMKVDNTTEVVIDPTGNTVTTETDFTNGITIAGGSDVLDGYSQNLYNADNDFSAGQVRVTRVGTLVTISGKVDLTSSSAGGAKSTSTGFIDTEYRPAILQSCLYKFDGTHVFEIIVRANGQITMESKTWSGGGGSVSAWGSPSISYNVEG